MNDRNPHGWVDASLAEIGMTKTEGINPSTLPNNTFELWSVPSFPTGEPEIVVGASVGSNKQKVNPNDVLLCKINPRINRVWKVEEKNRHEQIASTEWIVFRNSFLDADFLTWRFREKRFREELCADVTGVGGSLTRARPQTVKKIIVSLPPLNEQKRIVMKIEALQERSRNAREALAEVPKLVEQFKQLVLAAAFRGDLTKAWREQNPDIEPAEKLIERIRIERRQKWEADQLAAFKAKGKTPPNNWQSKYKEPSSIATAESPGTPVGWRQLTFGDLFDFKGGSQPPKSTFISEPEEGYIRLLQIRDFKSDKYPAYIKDADKWPKCTEKDIMVGRYGASVGQILSGMSGAYNVALVKLLYPEGNLSRGWVWYLLQSDVFQHPLKLLSRSAQNGFNKNELAIFPITLPPVDEQGQIATRIESLFAYADSIQEQAKASLEELDRLDQSILAKAFRGELVPQGPTDEPASALLERIKAERAAATPVRKKRKRQ